MLVPSLTLHNSCFCGTKVCTKCKKHDPVRSYAPADLHTPRLLRLYLKLLSMDCNAWYRFIGSKIIYHPPSAKLASTCSQSHLWIQHYRLYQPQNQSLLRLWTSLSSLALPFEAPLSLGRPRHPLMKHKSDYL